MNMISLLLNMCSMIGFLRGVPSAHSCRVGSKASRLQVDENVFRPLRRAFQSRGNKQGGNKGKVVVMQELAHQQTVTTFEEVQPAELPAVTQESAPQQNATTSEVVQLAELPGSAQQSKVAASVSSNQQVTVMQPEAVLHLDPSTDAGSLSPRIPPNSLVRQASLSLHNGFNVLSMEHPNSAIGDHSVVIALGADPIGCDD